MVIAHATVTYCGSLKDKQKKVWRKSATFHQTYWLLASSHAQ